MNAVKLDPGFLTRVEALTLGPRARARGRHIGAHDSPHEGASVVFAEHREYRPGDDPRRIDARAWARTDRPTIKRFEHESDRRATLLLDRSPSMDFRSRAELPTKLELGRQLLAGLAFLALRLGDRVMAGAYDEETLALLRETRGVRSLEAAVAPLFEDAVPGRRTSLERASRGITNVERSGLVVIVSDFIEESPAAAIGSLQPLALKRSELHVIHVLDPAEARLTLAVPARIEGLEGEAPLDVTPDPALTEAYDAAIEGLRREVRGAALALGATPHYFETTVDPVAAIAEIVGR
jgi:uncharacterized protein (DUF58 family)